jgi:hypothetical protein
MAGNVPAIKRAEAFNSAATSNTDILAADIGPVAASHPAVAFRVTVGIKPAATASVFNLQVNSGATAILQSLNGGAALTVGALYTFTFGASSTYTYNFQMATSTTIGYLLVEEIQSGAL